MLAIDRISVFDLAVLKEKFYLHLFCLIDLRSVIVFYRANFLDRGFPFFSNIRRFLGVYEAIFGNRVL